jgi:hypothetical protein
MIQIIIASAVGYFLLSFAAIAWILYQINRNKKRGDKR